MKFLKLFNILILVVAATGCKKDYLETKPSDAVPQQVALGTTESLTNSLAGAYQTLFAFSPGGSGRHDDFGQKSWDLANDLMGNDMVVHTSGYGWFNGDYQYTEWQNPTQNRRSDEAWFYYFNVIKQANTIIKNVSTGTGAQSDKDQIKGEALGLRAYGYFYLINYFQQTYKGNETKPGVPITLDPSDVGGKPRGTVQQVYDQISADLTAAESLLTGKSRTDKTHIDVSVIRGFEARVALIKEDWAGAANFANKARQGYPLIQGAAYSARTAFSSISTPEWMWGSLITSDKSTIYASFFSHIDISTCGYAALGGQKKITKDLYDQMATGDARKAVWTAPGSGTTSNPAYNQVKFQVPTAGNWAADYLYMRAAEMYLIEAEALSHTGQDAAARTVLTTLIQTRYPAYSISNLSGAALLSEILLQRRIELWGEGWSLMDIKRLKTGLNRPTGTGNHGSPSLDPSVYTLPDADPKFLMRIPQRELESNPALTPADQNP